MAFDLVVRGGTVVTPERQLVTDIGVANGRIAALGGGLEGRVEIDAAGMLVLPGAIDAHTHMAAVAGGGTSADDFLSGTRAAAAGGVTTIVDFTGAQKGRTLVEDIAFRRVASGEAIIDVALHAEMIGWRAGREGELAAAVDAGVTSFKFYMAYGDLGHRSDTGALLHAFRGIASLGAVATVHAEDDDIIGAARRGLVGAEETSMAGLPRSRPAIAEGAAVTAAAYLAEKAGARLHVCHVSSALGLEAVTRAKERSAALSAETCPQYLLLTEDAYREAEAAQYAVMPPLRSAADTEALWAALRDGRIDCVATDHCPFRREQKRLTGVFDELPYGLPGVETLLPLLFSEGVVRRRMPLEAVVRLLAEAPSRLFGLAPAKGRLAVGADADIVVFDPHATWEISADVLHMNTDFSPYEGMSVTGRVVTTVARGDVVYAAGDVVGEPGRGRFLERSVGQSSARTA